MMRTSAAFLLRGAVPAAFDGDGNGYGDGYGDGNGYGYGYGNGDGNGYGDGYGDGCGYGYGYGSKDYWLSCLKYFVAKWPEDRRARFDFLQKSGATVAYWRSDKSGRAVNGGSNDPVSPGTVEEIKGPLQIYTAQALHATVLPPKWKGERWWIVALIGEVQWEDDKCAALKREIIGECL